MYKALLRFACLIVSILFCVLTVWTFEFARETTDAWLKIIHIFVSLDTFMLGLLYMGLAILPKKHLR